MKKKNPGIAYRTLRMGGYQLTDDYFHDTEIITGETVKTEYAHMTPTGKLTLSKGFPWDGASGAFDGANTQRGTAVHDGLYGLMKSGHLNKIHRKAADKLMRKIHLADGMKPWRSWLWYLAVRSFGWRHIR